MLPKVFMRSTPTARAQRHPSWRASATKWTKLQKPLVRRADRAQKARLIALQDARRDIMGETVKRRAELEPAFSEVAKAYMKWWKAQPGLKESNTEKQKDATFRLFAGYWGTVLSGA